jgi:hypothetical protein
VFICCSRCKDETSNKKRAFQQQLLHPSVFMGSGNNGKDPMLLGTAGPPLASLGSLGSLASLHPVAAASVKDWDAVSMYSARSIPRARVYHGHHEDGGNISRGERYV